MEDRLRNVLERSQTSAESFNSKWTNIHRLYLESLGENWRNYINYIDLKVAELVRHPSLIREKILKKLRQFNIVMLSPLKCDSTISTPKLEELQSAMKRLQYLTDQITRTKSLLVINMEVMSLMENKISDLHASYSVLSQDPTFLKDLWLIEKDHMFLWRNACGLSDRASNLSNYVSG